MLMKLITTVLIIGVVAIALAFKQKGAGVLYCDNVCRMKIDFRCDPFGTFTDPCGNGGTTYALTPTGDCVKTGCTHYTQTAALK